MPAEVYYKVLRELFAKLPGVNAWLECERFSIGGLTIEEAIKELRKM